MFKQVHVVEYCIFCVYFLGNEQNSYILSLNLLTCVMPVVLIVTIFRWLLSPYMVPYGLACSTHLMKAHIFLESYLEDTPKKLFDCLYKKYAHDTKCVFHCTKLNTVYDL